MSPGWNLFNSQDSRIASQARISTGRQRAEPPPLDYPHAATGSPVLGGVNLPKTAGQKHKKYPRFQGKSGVSHFIYSPKLLGLCVSSIRCDTLRYSADGNSTLQNNLSATPTRWQRFCRLVIPVAPSFRCRLEPSAAKYHHVTFRRLQGQNLGQLQKRGCGQKV